jgi:hypothetical protein
MMKLGCQGRQGDKNQNSRVFEQDIVRKSYTLKKPTGQPAEIRIFYRQILICCKTGQCTITVGNKK